MYGKLIFIGRTTSKQPYKKGNSHEVRIVKLEGAEGFIVEVDKLQDIFYPNLREFMRNWKVDTRHRYSMNPMAFNYEKEEEENE